MSAPANSPSPSGRLMRTYYVVWGLLAAGGLGYLASFVPQFDQQVAAKQERPTIDPEAGMRVATQALSEIGNVRQSVTEIRKDVGQLKRAVDHREAQERESQARLAALEERVTSLAAPPAVAAAPAPEQSSHVRSVEKGVAASEKKAAARRATARVVAEVEGPSAQPAPALPAPPVETGSIAAPPGVTVAFGTPKVTAVREQHYSVQVGAGPSLDALRLTWSILAERHGALAVLKPRYVAPKAGSSVYRLVAGPLSSKADAEKVCADMGVGRQGCLPTTATGEPL
jgi:sporulation related protein